VVDAKKESFNFLGFTVRYSRDLFVRDKYYWELFPSVKSENKVREKIRDYLAKHGHCAAKDIAKGLNAIMRGWLNYFDVKGVSYAAMSKRRLTYYLTNKLSRYYNRKSQRRSRLYRQQAFEVLVTRHGMLDPTKYFTRTSPL